MKFIPNQDYREKIATLERLIANRKARSVNFRPAPFTDAERELVEGVTRYERRFHLVFRIGGQKVVTPFDKACQ